MEPAASLPRLRLEACMMFSVRRAYAGSARVRDAVFVVSDGIRVGRVARREHRARRGCRYAGAGGDGALQFFSDDFGAGR